MLFVCNIQITGKEFTEFSGLLWPASQRGELTACSPSTDVLFHSSVYSYTTASHLAGWVSEFCLTKHPWYLVPTAISRT